MNSIDETDQTSRQLNKTLDFSINRRQVSLQRNLIRLYVLYLLDGMYHHKQLRHGRLPPPTKAEVLPGADKSVTATGIQPNYGVMSEDIHGPKQDEVVDVALARASADLMGHLQAFAYRRARPKFQLRFGSHGALTPHPIHVHQPLRLG